MERNPCDSGEKNRAQNRQAQRLYRQRMKEKVRVLQAKVDAFELHANKYQQLSPIRSQSSQSPNGDVSESDLETKLGSLDHILGYHMRSPAHHLSPEIDWPTCAEDTSETHRHCFAECLEHSNLTGNSGLPSGLLAMPDTLGSLQHTCYAGPMETRPDRSITSLSAANHTPSRCPSYNRNVSSTTQELEHQQTTNGISSSITSCAVLRASPYPESTAMPIEDRINLVIAQARTAGYCDLGSAWHEYYTAALPVGSALSVEQRLSRNRRLPGVIASLSRSAQSWSAWERTGFQEQLVNSAEAVLINECRSFRHSVHYDTWHQAWLDGKDLGDDALSVFQEQLPNLAALVTSLTSNDSVRSPAKAKRLLAAICFDGI
ncbi:hypothetical protein AC579_3493 [Pseudocercospora musae]|uniref:BZIP domain-containing protein n=1 Tax=Pseudocercospora musae TaxID=113226 RepID=A0A139GTH2_9PEZI|nr:hypothetical protein AC579_3493 [Pseudocercospora musae]